MEFREFRTQLQAHVADMLEGQDYLFRTGVGGDDLWNLYLDSFPPGTNEIYRERPSHDCSCCKSFVRQFGSVVVIGDNYELTSIWDFDAGDETYQPVIEALAGAVKAAPVTDCFVTHQSGFGTDQNYAQMEYGDVRTWYHFRIDLPNRFVTSASKSVGSVMGELKATRDVFQRSLSELSTDAAETVLDLIAEDSLYRGEEWQGVLERFQVLQSEYRNTPEEKRDNFCWRRSLEVGGAVGRIRNHSIGVLLQDLTGGMDVVEAVRRFEAVVAPQNYKRPKPVFTQAMVEQARKTVKELGLLESLGRRHASLGDITINNVLWANRDAVREMKGLDVFDELAGEVTVNPRQFDHVEGLSASQFITEILPSVSSLAVLLENRHESSLVSLIAPQEPDAPTLFKWDNGFSWTYNGNLADSMKQRVKAAGGDVEGVLRFSLQWNTGHDNRNDFDAHCIEPGGNHIYYPNKAHRHPSSGMLDVDIIHPSRTQVAVENITWNNIRQMPEGEYRLYVHNYSHRGGRSGFEAEVEFDGRVYEYHYDQELAQSEEVMVSTVRFSRARGFEITHHLRESTNAREMWGVRTNQFQPVSTVTYSPNYWDEQEGVGNRHYFFFLAGCRNENRPNGFFNEYLRERFMEHKRVFAALGSKMRVERSDEQLSGLGFSSTKRNSLVCKVNGNRIVKVVF